MGSEKTPESKNNIPLVNTNPFQAPLDPKKQEQLSSAGDSIVCSYQNCEDESPGNYLNQKLLEDPNVKPSPFLQEYLDGNITELPSDFEPNSIDLAFIERHLAKLEAEKNTLFVRGEDARKIFEKMRQLQLVNPSENEKNTSLTLQNTVEKKYKKTVGIMGRRFYQIQEAIDKNIELKQKLNAYRNIHLHPDLRTSTKLRIDLQQSLFAQNPPQNRDEYIETNRTLEQYLLYLDAQDYNTENQIDPLFLQNLSENEYSKANDVIFRKSKTNKNVINLYQSRARYTEAVNKNEYILQQRYDNRNLSAEEIANNELFSIQNSTDVSLKTAYADYQKAEQEYQTYLIENEITENQAELKQADITVEPTNQTNTYTVNYEGIESEITVEAAPGGQGYIITVPDLNADNGKARAYKISDIQELNPKIKEIMQVVRIDKIWNQVLKNLRLTEQAKFINDQYISDLVRVFDLGIISDQSDLENFLTNFARLTLPESNFSTVKKLKWFNKIISSGDENAKKELKSILLTPESIPFEKLQETIEAKNFDVVYN